MAQAVTRPGLPLGIRIGLLISLLVASIALGFAIPNATADTLVTSEATSIIARVPNPQGSGSPLAVIRDGDKPAAGTTQAYRQYDSWDGANSASEDWVGYTFSGTRTFTRVVFQEGLHFWDGGWFISLTVHVRKNGIWTNVEGLSISPGYGGNDGVGFEIYTMSFTPMTGDAIRIIGKPGGSAAFISVGELEVYATASGSGSTGSSAPLPPPVLPGGSPPPANPTGRTFFTATNGSDGYPGTESQPFRTVHKGVTVLRPGDILYVKQGTYAETLMHDIPPGNSWDQAVTVAAYPGHVVTLRPSGTPSVLRFIAPQRYIVVRGFVLDAAAVTGDAVKITNTEIGVAHHIRIEDCEVKNSPTNGIMTTAGAHSNEFIGLDVHHNGRTDFHHGLYLATDSNLVMGSDIHENSGWGVHIYSYGGSVNYNVVQGNRLYNNARAGGRGSGVLVASGQGHQVYNNLVWGNYHGIEAWKGASGALIANNVVYANRFRGINPAPGSVNTKVHNNIMWQNDDDYWNEGSSTIQSYNLIGVDPHFVNAAGLDFHLRSDSPAIDGGTSISSTAKDYDGVSRPQHSAFDIGAFEWH